MANIAFFSEVVMLTDKKGRSILSARWGRPRSPSRLMRVSEFVFSAVHSLPEKDRRSFLDRAVRDYQKKIGG